MIAAVYLLPKADTQLNSWSDGNRPKRELKAHPSHGRGHLQVQRSFVQRFAGSGGMLLDARRNCRLNFSADTLKFINEQGDALEDISLLGQILGIERAHFGQD